MSAVITSRTWEIVVIWKAFQKHFELLNMRSNKRLLIPDSDMGKIFCVEFQRCYLKFHTKYLTHTLKYGAQNVWEYSPRSRIRSYRYHYVVLQHNSDKDSKPFPAHSA